MTRAARRLGCTEGQLYTLTTGLVLALLLVFAGVNATVSVPRAVAAVTGPAATPSTAKAGATPQNPQTSAVTTSSPASEASAPTGTDQSAPPTTGASPTPPPPTPPCTAQPALEASKQVLDALETATGVVPSASTEQLLASLSGCGTGDPAVLALGVLAELGSKLPDLPPPIIALVQPLRPAIDPICASTATVVQTVVMGAGIIPADLAAAVLNAVNPVLDACSQIQHG